MAIKAAVIGLGDIAKKAFLPILSALEGVDLFLYNRTPEKVAYYQQLYRIQDGSSNLEDVFTWQPQAAFILTTPQTHFEFIRSFLQAGIDVFTEKAATYDSNQTEELARLADQQGRILMVGYNRRYSPMNVQAKMAWGERPISLAFFEKNRSRALHPDLYRHLIDDTVHAIDTFRFFCGEARVLQTVAQEANGMVQGVMSLLELENGGNAVISGTMAAGSWLERYTIHGAQTSLVVNTFTGFQLRDEQKQHSWSETYDSSWKTTLEGRGFKGEIDHFFDCITTRQQPHSSAWDSVKTQRLVEDIFKAVKR
jgi:virulence factor